MAHALGLAARGLGATWPNPAVGCVIVQGSRIVGRGWTQPGGRPHAEAVALAQAGDAARGATAYVTLEPCAHLSERGPDCSGSLIAAGLARVVTALQDPDPRTAGRGHARLRAAGIAVETGCMAEEAADDLGGFLSRVLSGKVSVTLKLASTLDGRIATASGESKWITGPLARRDVHALRARHDAVLVGVGTALADDPALTVRDLGVTRQPVRVVMDSRLRLPVTSRLGQSAGQVPVWLLHGTQAPDAACAAWQAVGARLIELPSDGKGSLDAFGALQALAGAGLTRVLCEGGAGVAGALLATGRVDRLVIYQAGRVFGADGLAAVAPFGVRDLPSGPAPWRLIDVVALGEDIRARWARRG